jgi:hypothetical protein
MTSSSTSTRSRVRAHSDLVVACGLLAVGQAGTKKATGGGASCSETTVARANSGYATVGTAEAALTVRSIVHCPSTRVPT